MRLQHRRRRAVPRESADECGLQPVFRLIFTKYFNDIEYESMRIFVSSVALWPIRRRCKFVYIQQFVHFQHTGQYRGKSNFNLRVAPDADGRGAAGKPCKWFRLVPSVSVRLETAYFGTVPVVEWRFSRQIQPTYTYVRVRTPTSIFPRCPNCHCRFHKKP